MSYYFNKTVNLSFDKAIAGVTEELKREGFGILTEFSVPATHLLHTRHCRQRIR